MGLDAQSLGVLCRPYPRRPIAPASEALGSPGSLAGVSEVVWRGLQAPLGLKAI
jgi:hypothetical protein